MQLLEELREFRFQKLDQGRLADADIMEKVLGLVRQEANEPDWCGGKHEVYCSCERCPHCGEVIDDL